MNQFEMINKDFCSCDLVIDQLFKRGLSCSIGENGEKDLISAHKWFNIASMLGKKEALKYRKEIACELDEIQIAEAQRAAREWLCAQ